MYYEGVYHLFYQHNPYSPEMVKELLVWGHSTSRDLINWTPRPIILQSSPPDDQDACWSGSATILPEDPDKRPAILYTGRNPNGTQVQNLAYPKDLSDPHLKEWVKSPKNPVMSAPDNGYINKDAFRDPSTAWKHRDGKWRVTVGTGNEDRGVAALFTSTDFENWTVSDLPLYSAYEPGPWECPDFFPVYIENVPRVVGEGVKHVYVLKVSVEPSQYDYYTLGTYNTDNDTYDPEELQGSVREKLRLDYGKFYASKTFKDPKTDRRILWAWIDESRSENAGNINKGWAGVQAIPRTVWLDQSRKRLVFWPIKEIETLRDSPVNLPSQVIKGGSELEISGITAAQADVVVEFKVTDLENIEEINPASTEQSLWIRNAEDRGELGPFGLLTLASEGLKEYTAVFFRVYKASDGYRVYMCTDLQKASESNRLTDDLNYGTLMDVNPENGTLTLSLRILIDHSIVESFGAKGKHCMTARVYPTLAVNDKAKLYVFNYGQKDVEIASLTAWSMDKAWINQPLEDEANSIDTHERDVELGKSGSKKSIISSKI